MTDAIKISYSSNKITDEKWDRIFGKKCNCSMCGCIIPTSIEKIKKRDNCVICPSCVKHFELCKTGSEE